MYLVKWIAFLWCVCLFVCLVKYLFRLHFHSVIARVNRWSVTNSIPSTNSLSPGI